MAERRHIITATLLLALCVTGTAPVGALEVAVLRDETIDAGRSVPPDGTVLQGRFDLALVVVAATGWSRDEVRAAALEALPILARCGVGPRRVVLLEVAVAPRGYRDFHTPRSRELAAALPLPRPAAWFVADTRQHPAFDAEAIGRGNSRTRPELADTVWLTRAIRNPAIALAHELYHVLANSGSHVDDPGNLMRDETDPAHTRLDDAQCARLVAAARRHGLLHAP